MATYLMLGKYSAEAQREISAERTRRASEVVKKCGGKVISIHALLGNHDVAILLNLPGNKEATKASLGLSQLTGIAFTTSPAIEVRDFDKLVSVG